MTPPNEIMHLVLFKWKPGTKQWEVDEVLTALRRLKTAIPGILELHAGQNFCARSQGFDTALMVRFTDRAALEAYGPHPEHRNVVDKYINPLRIDSLAVDYDIAD